MESLHIIRRRRRIGEAVTHPLDPSFSRRSIIAVFLLPNLLLSSQSVQELAEKELDNKVFRVLPSDVTRDAHPHKKGESETHYMVVGDCNVQNLDAWESMAIKNIISGFAKMEVGKNVAENDAVTCEAGKGECMEDSAPVTQDDGPFEQ